jgi:hypothetical protein
MRCAKINNCEASPGRPNYNKAERGATALQLNHPVIKGGASPNDYNVSDTNNTH